MSGSVWVVDRVEDGRRAVLISDGDEERVVDVADLPGGTEEGDVLVRDEGGWRADPETAERLRREADDLRSSLRRGPEGPISL